MSASCSVGWSHNHGVYVCALTDGSLSSRFLVLLTEVPCRTHRGSAEMMETPGVDRIRTGEWSTVTSRTARRRRATVRGAGQAERPSEGQLEELDRLAFAPGFVRGRSVCACAQRRPVG
jgi:hypothetical protein